MLIKSWEANACASLCTEDMRVPQHSTVGEGRRLGAHFFPVFVTEVSQQPSLVFKTLQPLWCFRNLCLILIWRTVLISERQGCCMPVLSREVKLSCAFCLSSNFLTLLSYSSPSLLFLEHFKPTAVTGPQNSSLFFHSPSHPLTRISTAVLCE